MKTEEDLKTAKPCVLLVEDEPTQSLFVKQMLSGQYQVYQAFDGREALRMLYTHEFDLVLMDINLGEGFLSGFHLIDYIRMQERFNSLKVFAVTAERLDVLEDNVSFGKFDDYIPKPVTKDTLHEAIQRFSPIRS